MPDLLEMVKARQSSRIEGNYGIQTADNFVKTLQTCVGSDLCNRYASTKATSFHDLVKRASNTLTYSNPELVAQDVYSDEKARGGLKDLGIEVPKHTLMLFRNRLTTPRKDRDNDVLKTIGARVDPKMLLLWQHVHTLPIGKFLGIAEHNEKFLDVYTAIVDLNELAQDSAVMVEAKMLRFSHGFKATEFEARKVERGQPTGSNGFEVKEFDIMEESGVSVPANVDAEVQEIYLDLIESDKLSSSMMKAYGKTIRSERTSVTSAGGLDLEKGSEDETKTADGSGGCGCGKTEGACTCASKKEDDKPDGEGKGSGTDSSKVADKEDKARCPGCGGEVIDGVCKDCGEKLREKPAKKEEDEEETPEKAASTSDDDGEEEANEPDDDKDAATCPKCGATMKEGTCTDTKCGYKAGMKAEKQKPETCPKCAHPMEKGICTNRKCGYVDPKQGKAVEPSAKDAALIFLTKASSEEREKLYQALTALREVDTIKANTMKVKRFLTPSK